MNLTYGLRKRMMKNTSFFVVLALKDTRLIITELIMFDNCSDSIRQITVVIAEITVKLLFTQSIRRAYHVTEAIIAVIFSVAIYVTMLMSN